MEKHLVATTLAPHRIREIACAAMVDPKTAKRVVDGLPTRPMCRERVELALRAAGLAHLVREEPATTMPRAAQR